MEQHYSRVYTDRPAYADLDSPEKLTIDYSMRTEEEIERLDEAVDMAIEALNHAADISKKVMKEN